MATVIEYYLPSSGAQPHSAAASAFWNTGDFATYPYAAVTSKSNSGMVRANSAGNPSGDTKRGVVQFVGPAIGVVHDFTPADTFKFQMTVGEDTEEQNGFLALSIRVFNADCTAVVGTIYEGYDDNEMSLKWTFTNRNLGGAVNCANTFSSADTDHIVIEIGYRNINDPGGYAAGCSFYIGDVTAQADLPENETDTSQTKNSWIQFTLEAGGGATGGGAVGLDDRFRFRPSQRI